MDAKRTNGALVLVIVAIVIALPFLYVLSVGPADAYFQNRATPEWVTSFYSPLAWLANQSTACKAWLLWYIDLWK